MMELFAKIINNESLLTIFGKNSVVNFQLDSTYASADAEVFRVKASLYTRVQDLISTASDLFYLSLRLYNPVRIKYRS